MAATTTTPKTTLSTPRSRTKYVSTACVACQQKKVKCDGTKPRCSSCVLALRDCMYRPDVDKRKQSRKNKVQSLARYCQVLEGLLRENGIPLPPLPDDLQEDGDEDRLRLINPPVGVVRGTPRTSKSEVSPVAGDALPTPRQAGAGTGTSTGPDGMSFGPATPSSDEDENDDNDDDEAERGNESGSHATMTLHQSSPVIVPESEMSLIDKLSSRMGSMQIAEDGQLRFFGATSNLHIIHKGPLSLARSRFRSASQDAQKMLESAGVGHPVSRELEDHLLKLYFCWEDTSIHIVNEDVFWRERARYLEDREAEQQHGLPPRPTSPRYSEGLTNAMCAFGAAFTSRSCLDLPEPLVDFFAVKAKVLLEPELDSPGLATVQAHVVLSAIEASLARDARGWLTSGMAVRLAIDLGLHQDPQPLVDAGRIDAAEAEYRTEIWGGVFVHDRMWSLYMGRPAAVHDRDITVPLPQPETLAGTRIRYWTPYTDEMTVQTSGLDAQFDDLGQFIALNITLCSRMSYIREHFYPDSQRHQNLGQLYLRAEKARADLLEWHARLPVLFQVGIDGDRDNESLNQGLKVHLPHVIQIHMQYHALQICIHRPFFSLRPSQATALTTAQIAASRSHCLESATAIARLTRLYRRLYTLRRINAQSMHLVFTASLIHLVNVCKFLDPIADGEAQVAAWRDLETCCQALSELGVAYKSCARAMEVVMHVKSELLAQQQQEQKQKQKARLQQRQQQQQAQLQDQQRQQQQMMMSQAYGYGYGYEQTYGHGQGQTGTGVSKRHYPPASSPSFATGGSAETRRGNGSGGDGDIGIGIGGDENAQKTKKQRLSHNSAAAAVAAVNFGLFPGARRSFTGGSSVSATKRRASETPNPSHSLSQLQSQQSFIGEGGTAAGTTIGGGPSSTGSGSGEREPPPLPMMFWDTSGSGGAGGPFSMDPLLWAAFDDVGPLQDLTPSDTGDGDGGVDVDVNGVGVGIGDCGGVADCGADCGGGVEP